MCPLARSATPRVGSPPAERQPFKYLARKHTPLDASPYGAGTAGGACHGMQHEPGKSQSPPRRPLPSPSRSHERGPIKINTSWPPSPRAPGKYDHDFVVIYGGKRIRVPPLRDRGENGRSTL
eukprot:7098869-Prymnesium_polylepis.1